MMETALNSGMRQIVSLINRAKRCIGGLRTPGDFLRELHFQGVALIR